MKKRGWYSLFLSVSLACCLICSSHAAGTEPAGIESEGAESASISEEKGDFRFPSKFQSFSDWLGSVIPGHLELGVRSTHFAIIDDKKDSFVGSVDCLDAVQNYDPTRVFLDWIFWSGENVEWGSEITWDRVAARTLTTSDGHNDGTLFASGPIWTLIGRYKNDGRFTPYAGLGAAFYNHPRVAKGWWHYGFHGEPWQEADKQFAAWRESGSPSWPNRGYNRTFHVDGSTGLVGTLGCSVKIGGNWEADFYGRYTNIVLDNEYTLSYYGKTFQTSSHEFDLTNMAYGIGVKYVFG